MEKEQGNLEPGSVDRPTINHYQVLDIDPEASRLDIREAYLRLKNAYSNGNAALYSMVDEREAKANLARIETAFGVLNDNYARRDFDIRMGYVREDRSAGYGHPNYSQSQTSQTERLTFMRQRAGQSEQRYWADSETISRGDETSVVHTTRSTLPVIKTKATGAGSDHYREKLQEVIANSDPADANFLKRLREAVGVDFKEIQGRTKITHDHIEALEAGTLRLVASSGICKRIS